MKKRILSFVLTLALVLSVLAVPMTAGAAASTEDKLAALKVTQMIDQLPATIYSNDLATIEAIQDAYDGLTADQKALVDMSRITALQNRIDEVDRLMTADPIRVTCVGDSITEGMGSSDWNGKSYPAKMQAILGNTYSVLKCGKSGFNVMVDRGDPYVTTQEYRNSMNSNPDIVIVALGTNDAGNGIWNTAPDSRWDTLAADQFEKDYRELLQGYMNLSTKPVVLAALPTHSWNKGSGQVDGRNNNNEAYVIPIIKRVAAELGVTTLDMWSWSENLIDYFGDGLHPNDVGYDMLAAEYARHVLAATEVVTDHSVDGITLDGADMAEFDENIKNYRVEVDSLNDLPEVAAKFTQYTHKTVTVEQATAANPTATVTAIASVGVTGTVYSVTFYEKVENDPEVAEVAALIDAIDDATITLADDEVDVELAHLSYKALSEGQKAQLDTDKVAKLTAAVAKVKTLNDQRLAAEVTGMINAIGEVTLESGDQIAAARAAYDALTDEQKELVKVLDTLTAAEKVWDDLGVVREAIALIDEMPLAVDVAIANKEAVESAQAAYDALSDDYKAMISAQRIEKLNAAIAALEVVLAHYDKYEAESAVLSGGAGVVTTPAEDVSGGAFAGSLGAQNGGGGKVTFTVTVDAAGEYTIDLYYITYDTRSLDVTVNGGNSIHVNMPGNGVAWDTGVQMASAVVYLNAGNNTVVVGNNSGWGANLDFIAIPTLDSAGDAELTDDARAAKAVEALIDALPATCTIAQTELIEKAQDAYDALTDAQKELLPAAKVEKLEAAIDVLETALASYIKYEAEAAVVAGGASVSTSNLVEISGGAFVGSLGAANGGGGTVTFTVSVEEAGDYAIDFYYMTYMDRAITVTVNDGTSVNVATPGNNIAWESGVQVVSTTVSLKAGENTIKVGNDSGWAPNIDFITLPVPTKTGGATDPDQAAADGVIAQIEDLGEITSLDQKADVEAARAAYDALTDAQKTLVTNTQKLTDAEATIKALEEEQNPPVEKVVGDVDASGVVDVADIMKLKALIMADKWSNDELAVGDMDDSDRLDVGDIMAIKNIIMSK